MDTRPDSINGLVRLSQNLYLFRDCCNVYIIRDGNSALLIDFGTGKVLQCLERLGIRSVEKLIHTNHHRDMCCGDHFLGEDTEILVPEAERPLFDSVEKMWANKRVYVNYREDSVFFSRTTNIRCSGVNGGNVIKWRGYTFEIIETPGDSRNSISIRAEIDGKKVIFCGDIISAPGKVHNIYDFQWDYMPSNYKIFKYWLESIEKLKSMDMDLLCPSHGSPMENGYEALDLLARKVSELQKFLHPERRPHQTPAFSRVLPHLVYIDFTSYIIISESGKGFLVDFGYVDHNCIKRLSEEFGLKHIDVITISHYHDDHIARISEMQYRHASSPHRDLEIETQVWTIEEMADILKNPKGYNIPCLFPSNLDAVVLKSGSKVRWEEFDLYFYHMPGQTEFAQGLFADIDGRRVLFTGDNIWIATDGHLVTPVIFKNVMIPAHLQRSARIMLEMKPDILCTGHTGATVVEPGMLEGYVAWTNELDRRLSELIDQEAPLYGIDTRWACFYPYVAEVLPGAEFKVWLRVRNYNEYDALITAKLNLPAGFTCEAPEQSAVAAAAGYHDFCFKLRAPDKIAPGTKLAVTADIIRARVECSQAVEFIVEVIRELPYIL